MYDTGVWPYGLNDSRVSVGHVRICLRAYPDCTGRYTQAFRSYAGVSTLLPKFPESINGLVQAVGFCVIANKRRAIRWDITVREVSIFPPGPTP